MNEPQVGHYFHTMRDGKIENQGQVINALMADTYEVQLFSWIDGEPTTRKIVAAKEMADWNFYASRTAWLAAGRSALE